MSTIRAATSGLSKLRRRVQARGLHPNSAARERQIPKSFGEDAPHPINWMAVKMLLNCAYDPEGYTNRERLRF